MPRPLRIAALIKQIPVAETLTLGPNGRLVRQGLALEMNAYCRRAVSKGVELARDSGGSCTVFTLGPPSAEDVLREAIAWGADEGVHLCDAAFEGSDTLATARATAAALRAAGPFDLVLVGRNSLDGETGQVGPEVAQLLGLPFATGVRVLAFTDDPAPRLALELELDDGRADADVALPAVLSVAERLCEPCKVDPAGRAAVPAERITRVSVAELGPGPWGDDGSPTRVGAVRPMVHHRARLVFSGDLDAQVADAVAELSRRGALDSQATGPADPTGSTDSKSDADPVPEGDRTIAVIVEHDRLQQGLELIGAAATLTASAGGTVHALAPDTIAVEALAAAGATQVVQLTGSRVADDVAAHLLEWIETAQPWVVLAPSTAFGREVAARLAAARGAGLVGDAIALRAEDGTLVAAKPAFAGALVADITCTSALQLVTLRPGVMSVPALTGHRAVPTTIRHVEARGRVRLSAERRDDDVEALARAAVVIGVGTGVQPDEYEDLSPLAAVLGAELAATRKVTDKGWAPRSRQIGITGRALAPRLYIALGLSGKFNHMVGVRAAGTILAVNGDTTAPVFEHCDIGIVGDWHDVLPRLTAALRAELRTGD